jgi:hypothetical protein
MQRRNFLKKHIEFFLGTSKDGRERFEGWRGGSDQASSVEGTDQKPSLGGIDQASQKPATGEADPHFLPIKKLLIRTSDWRLIIINTSD